MEIILRKAFTILAAISMLSSIARAQTPAATAGDTADAHKPVPQVAPQEAAAIMQHTGGSLLQATMATQRDPGQAKLEDVSYFSVPDPEPHTIKKHDLLTIIVREESESKSEGTTDLKKQADIDTKLDAFIGFSLANFALKQSIGSSAPEVKAELTRDFKGEATVDRSDSLTARITAEVLDVKPNGTLVLQARKRLKADDETQTFILTGTCRAEDIAADNTVLSTQLYDLELNKTHTGAVRDTTKRGWVPKLLDALNPF